MSFNMMVVAQTSSSPLMSLKCAFDRVDDRYVGIFEYNKIKKITELNFCHNISDKVIQILAGMPLTALKIESCDLITNTGIEALCSMSHLTSLHLPHNDMDDATANILAQIKSLRSLDLTDNSITSEGLKMLARSSLTSLNLCENWVGGYEETRRNEDALILKEISSPTLSFLDLSWNNLRDEGVIAFSISARKIPSLASLSVSGNEIGAEGATALFKIKTLKSLDLSFNEITNSLTQSAIEIHRALGWVYVSGPLFQSQIKSLDLTGNQLGNAGVAILAFMPFLADLKVTLNGIEDAGAWRVAQSSTICTLDIYDDLSVVDYFGMRMKNEISGDMLQSIQKRMQDNRERHSLYWAQIAFTLAFHRASRNSSLIKTFPFIVNTLKPWLRSA